MAQRTRRRSQEPRRAPAWVPDVVLERLGQLSEVEGFAHDARRAGGAWVQCLDTLLAGRGGSVPAAELLEPLDDLEARYGAARVALSMLRAGLPMSISRKGVLRLAELEALEPAAAATHPALDEVEAGSGAPARVTRERDRLAEELRREREHLREKDRKLREERAAHTATRSELTSDRDKARHAAQEAMRQLAAGPSGAAIDELRAERDSALQQLEAAAAATAALRLELDAARVEARRHHQDAERGAEELRRERERAASAASRPPSDEEFLRAARHIGAAAMLRLDAPARGDAELIETLAAVTRWRQAAHGQPRRSERSAGDTAASSPDPSRPTAGAAAGRPAAPAAPLRLTIVGGGSVGSSAYLVEAGGKRILLDCGMGGATSQLETSAIDAVVLSHAHGDHMGGLAGLLRRQPNLRVFCSAPTKQLARYQASAADEYLASDRLLVRSPGELYRILDGTVELLLHRTAHVFGSCAVRLRLPDDRLVVYSGDLGGAGLLTLRPPDPLPLRGASLVLLEATLGDRGPVRASHTRSMLREVTSVINADGCAVFPASSIGRAQEIAATVAAGTASGALPDAPVLISPLAKRVLDRYRLRDRDGWLADCAYPDVHVLRSDHPAEAIVSQPSYVIVGGASGLERRAGELVAAAAKRERCGVFFTGYSGPAARQWRTGDVVEMTGEDGQLARTVIASRWLWVPSPDHPSQRELVRAVDGLDRSVPIVLVHGVDDAKRALADKLRAAGHTNVRSARDGAVIEV